MNLFPHLQPGKWIELNLNEESKSASIDFTDPVAKLAWTHSLHRARGAEYSFGGFLEDRSHLWKDHYQKEQQLFIHLGVDFAVPVGTETALLERSRVEHIMLDKESYGGWGGRVLVQSLESLQYFIYGHLRHDIPLLVGEIYAAGTVLGTVGETQVNGGWAPHLHLQRMDETFIRHYAQHLEAIDGYMHRGNPLLEHVLDPMPLVKFLKE
ncbi:MAG TPA: peptidoglycan DD-metalloendopeptidase family protein [Candidatus Nanoarchaeia archaeon]|nr:peptidoglycan DD-metalloendopeptidase family protein [Candidatus Nanoarchaeia archaeon]